MSTYDSGYWQRYAAWQDIVLQAYNERNGTSLNIDDVDVCEDGCVYEGNLSWDTGFITWNEFSGD